MWNVHYFFYTFLNITWLQYFLYHNKIWLLHYQNYYITITVYDYYTSHPPRTPFFKTSNHAASNTTNFVNASRWVFPPSDHQPGLVVSWVAVQQTLHTVSRCGTKELCRCHFKWLLLLSQMACHGGQTLENELPYFHIILNFYFY